LVGRRPWVLAGCPWLPSRWPLPWPTATARGSSSWTSSQPTSSSPARGSARWGTSIAQSPPPALPLDHCIVGTPGYQNPEFLREQFVTSTASLGILMWQQVAREIHFSGQHPQTVMFRGVSVGARPSPPPSHTVRKTSFTSLYKSC